MYPFLKWAGGKRWLGREIEEVLPQTYGRYIEPFLGGGAIFFHLEPKAGLLSDVNPALIETYCAIRENWQLVSKYLEIHNHKHRRKYYYEIRESSFNSVERRAAKFIYLNRTCWNGLYRVNRQGDFNVPIGTKTAVLLPDDNFEHVSKLLRRMTIRCRDFEKTIQKAKADDLLYVDPPYTINHAYNGFLKYNEKLFSWADQIRLRDSIIEAVGRGVHVIISNAYHRSVRDLYSQPIFKKHVINRHVVIAAASQHRGIGKEYLIYA